MMKEVYYYVTPLGIAIVDQQGNIIDFFMECKEAKECAERYLNKDYHLEEIAKKLEKEGYKIIGEYKGLLNYLDYIKKTYEIDEKSLEELLRKTLLEIARNKIREEISWDRIVINLADTVEDITKIANLLYERLIEMYGLYFPELVETYEGDMEKLVKDIYEIFDRDKLAEKYNLSKESVGIDFDEDLKKITKEISKKILELLELKKEISRKIQSILEKYLPNTLSLTGPLILSKLLSLAGSIEKLIKFPASTIQVLGAEKALFRHLMKGTPPPKHGILFQHPLVNKAPKKLRGRIARTLAAKISIALKVDYYSQGKKNIAKELKKELDERIKSLYEEYKNES